MLILKTGVQPAGLAPEMHFALGIATVLYQTLGDCDCVVTSLLDGKHNPGSLHSKGQAADLRTRNLDAKQRMAIFTALKRYLEPVGFDVIYEGGVGATPATTGGHYHIEFQPKPGESFLRYGA